MVWWISQLLDKTLDYLNWMFSTMDVTQWGIFSAVMVTLGFVAIKCR